MVEKITQSYRITDPSQRPLRKECGPIPHKDKPLPSFTARVGNYLATLAEHRENNQRLIPLEVRQWRWEQCEPCEYRNRERNACSKCGCPLSADNILGDKLSWEVSKCPVGKWHSWKDTPVNGDWINRPEVWPAFRGMIAREVDRLRTVPDESTGAGVVICGGGKYFASTYCNIRLIRHHGCTLPIEVWYLGSKNEMPKEWRAIVEPYGVRCIDADSVRETKPARILNGWELKFYAVTNTTFRKVIFLDADCFPMRDPTPLLDSPQFLGSGAVFQRDCSNFEFIKPEVLRLFGAKEGSIWDLETGAFMIDKRRWWLPLQLTNFLNSYSDLVYKVVYGDKTTPAIAAGILDVPYSVPHHAPTGGGSDGWGLMQRWFDGSEMWQHRIHMKPSLTDTKYTSNQTKSPKAIREVKSSLAWSNEIDIYLDELRKLL